MSSIAQKLCDEICEDTPFKQCKQSCILESFEKLSTSSTKYVGRPTRSVTVEKKRVINKLVPSGSSSSKDKIVINNFKSKKTLLKKTFVDTALNTIITGPLRCDNNSVTVVRKRDISDNCKCGNKRPNCKMRLKEIQTFDTKHLAKLDKACAQCIEMVNCGTQFVERLGSKKILSNRSRSKLSIEVDTQTNQLAVEKDYQRRKKYELPPNRSKINFMGARRWALSKYPTRGPDF